MEITRWRLRSILIVIVLGCVTLGIASTRVLADVPYWGRLSAVPRFLLLLVAVLVPVVVYVAAGSGLARGLEAVERSVVAVARAQRDKLYGRKRTRSQRRAEHRLAMKQLVIDYAARHQALPVRNRANP
jgi:hypothetical protein